MPGVFHHRMRHIDGLLVATFLLALLILLFLLPRSAW